ncbi:putative membrane protein [Mariprofundus ferrinatatus]|uniref:Putative membrane protein n=1 Tax=Mariprofundus ferrinatatus TaxID=1921087 RepID=A0A2K8L697_9PROT|nr:DUF2079 domain-containing protein [Mariprofundus ferrinatatus]ATX81779.1 putative membrane protein [Mariprofundus ferrinatatus]
MKLSKDQGIRDQKPAVAVADNRNVWRTSLWAAISFHFSLFIIIGLSRHWGFMTSINDLGTFDQVVWNTLNGNLLHTTINPFATSMVRLGIHFDPILFLFVPLYAITPSVEWFAIAQAAALALTAYPLFLLGTHIFQSEKSGFIWAVIYLVNPFLISAGAWDFHPITLAVPFMALALLATVKNRPVTLTLSCLILLACKEHMGLAVIGFAVLWWWLHRSWRVPTTLFALGAIHLVIVLAVIMPHFSPLGAHAMLGDELGQMSRYSWLGSSLTEVLRTLLTQPAFVWGQISQMGGLSYWGLLLLPFILFPTLGLPFLLPGVADLIANTLAANPMPRGMWSYHSATLIPPLAVAAMYGVKRLARWQDRFSIQELAGLVLITSVVTGYIYLPLPLIGAKNIWSPNHVLNLPDSDLQRVRSAAGDSTILSVQANIGAHFTQRQQIYIYPNKVDEVDAIILRLESPTTNIGKFQNHSTQGSRKGYQTWLDGHLQLDRTEYLASIECLLSNKEFGVQLWNDPWLVLSKDAETSPLEVISSLRELRTQWLIADDEYSSQLEVFNANVQTHGYCLVASRQ